MTTPDHTIHELIRARWSPRAFATRPVEAEKVAQLLEAARWAASSYNDQPWQFIVTTAARQAGYGKLMSCLVPDNQSWAATAPVLILTVARLAFEHNGKPNRHAIYDLGQAVGTLLVQATALGLHAHQMAGFDAELARRLFRIPAGHEPMAVAAVGYLGDAARLPPGVEEKDPATRERKAVAEFAFLDGWGEPFAGE